MKVVKENNIYKIPTETIKLDYSPNPVLINDVGVITSQAGGNGWVIYDKSANYSEVFLMLNYDPNSAYPRWQNGAPNAYAFLKTPQKGILTRLHTTQWCDEYITGRICNHWKITGYETEAEMLALTNGTVLVDDTWVTVNKGEVRISNINNDKPFQYYTIHMVSNFAGGSYCSMGITKFYMRLPNKSSKTVYKAIIS